MSRAVEAAELKALVRALVKAFGGIEAAAVELGISAERVSQFQRPGCPDQMSILCICKLEAVLGRSIVTGTLARAADCGAPDPVTDAVVGLVGASASALHAISDMDRDGQRDVGEIRQVQRATQEALHEAELLADAASRLTPGAVVH